METPPEKPFNTICDGDYYEIYPDVILRWENNHSGIGVVIQPDDVPSKVKQAYQDHVQQLTRRTK